MHLISHSQEDFVSSSKEFFFFSEKLFQFFVTSKVLCVSLSCWLFIEITIFWRRRFKARLKWERIRSVIFDSPVGNWNMYATTKLSCICLNQTLIGLSWKSTSLSKRRWVSGAGTEGEQNTCVNQYFLEDRPVFLMDILTYHNTYMHISLSFLTLYRFPTNSVFLPNPWTVGKAKW